MAASSSSSSKRSKKDKALGKLRAHLDAMEAIEKKLEDETATFWDVFHLVNADKAIAKYTGKLRRLTSTSVQRLLNPEPDVDMGELLNTKPETPTKASGQGDESMGDLLNAYSPNTKFNQLREELLRRLHQSMETVLNTAEESPDSKFDRLRKVLDERIKKPKDEGADIMGQALSEGMESPDSRLKRLRERVHAGIAKDRATIDKGFRQKRDRLYRNMGREPPSKHDDAFVVPEGKEAEFLDFMEAVARGEKQPSGAASLKD